MSIGTCARAFGTPCVHEHVCVRCSLLLAEAEREGRLGAVEGLHVSLAGAQSKPARLDGEQTRRDGVVDLGLPSFSRLFAPSPSSKPLSWSAFGHPPPLAVIGVLVVQQATGTLSPRYMRLWYRDRLQKAVLATFTGTFAFAFSLLRSNVALPAPGRVGRSES
ncbi:DUF2254 family protein [Streptomyces sp. NPDC055287]